jgi:hypothetical protein
MWFLLRSLVLALIVTLAAASAALASPGEKIILDEDLTDEFEGFCPFDIEVHLTGHIRLWSDPAGKSAVFRGTFAGTFTFTGVESGQSVRFRDVGADRVRVLDDGTTEVAIIGRALGPGTIGRLLLVFDAEGDFVDARHAGRTVDGDAICAAIAP